MRTISFLAVFLLVLVHCGTVPTNPIPDLKPATTDMAVAPQLDLSPTPALVSVSPATLPIGADTTITVTGTNSHFDTWCDIGASTSFAPCVLNSFSTKVVNANTVHYLISVPAGAQPTSCNIAIQPRVVNGSGGCGANAGALLQLSPAFNLE